MSLFFVQGSEIQHFSSYADGQNRYASFGERSRQEVIEMVTEAVATSLGQSYHTFFHATRFYHPYVFSSKSESSFFFPPVPSEIFIQSCLNVGSHCSVSTKTFKVDYYLYLPGYVA